MSDFADVWTFWMRRPNVCLDEGCDEPATWVGVYADKWDQDTIESAHVDGFCDEHKDPRWADPDITRVSDPNLVVAAGIGRPQVCCLRPTGRTGLRCGRPEDCVALYLVGPPELVRVGAACADCLKTQEFSLEGSNVLCRAPHPCPRCRESGGLR